MVRNAKSPRRTTSEGAHGRTWSPAPPRSNWSTAAGLIAGAGVGAALMYLFDPEQGRTRRSQLTDTAGDMFDSASGAVSSALHHAGEHAETLAQSLPRSMPDTSALTGAVSDKASQWFRSARSYLPHRTVDRGPQVSMQCAAMSTSAALLIGLGSMWLFDAARGRGRRAWLMQKATRTMNETGRFMSATGRHLRNKMKGYRHELMPQQVTESTCG